MPTDTATDQLRYAAQPATLANNNRGYSTPLEDGPHTTPNSYRRSTVPAPSKLRDPSTPGELAAKVSAESQSRNESTYRTRPFPVSMVEHEVEARPRPFSNLRSLTRSVAPTVQRAFLPALDTKERTLSGRRFSGATWAIKNGAQFGLQPPTRARRTPYTDIAPLTNAPEIGVRITASAPPSRPSFRRGTA